MFINPLLLPKPIIDYVFTKGTYKVDQFREYRPDRICKQVYKDECRMEYDLSIQRFNGKSSFTIKDGDELTTFNMRDMPNISIRVQ